MKAFLLLVLFGGWTLINAQISPNDRVNCSDAYPGGRPEVCPAIYAPVCASVQVECIRAPCPPVQENYPSGCNACASDRVDYFIEGECPDQSDDDVWGEGENEEWICEGELETCWGEEENCWAWEDDHTDGDDDNGNPVVEEEEDDGFIIVDDGEIIH